MKLTIVGLDVVGTSLAMALKAAGGEVEITGHDPDAEHIKRAKELKAIDKSHWNLISACDGAEIIVLDEPLPAMAKDLEGLGKYLGAKTVVLDTASLKRPVMGMAARLLPKDAQFIGGHMVSDTFLAGTAEPAADLPKDATFFMVAPESLSSESINLATTLVEAVGATPRFIEAEEHDGLMAATNGLPLASAMAIFAAVAEPAGFQERCKSVGAELISLGAQLGPTPEATAELALGNADYLVPWVDACISRLEELRQLLVDKDRDSMDKYAAQVHATLLQCWRRGEAPKGPGISDAGLGLRQMFLGNWGRRRPDETQDKTDR